jgi:hypothetical protein
MANWDVDGAHLRYPGLHPACPQATCQGLGREHNKHRFRCWGGKRERFPLSTASGRCRFGEGTFAGTRGNDGDAPSPDLPALTAERGRFDPKQIIASPIGSRRFERNQLLAQVIRLL